MSQRRAHHDRKSASEPSRQTSTPHLWQRVEAHEQEVRAARQKGDSLAEAHACERAALFFLEQGADQIAAMYLTRAYQRYGKAQAETKRNELKRRYANLLPLENTSTPSLSEEQLEAEKALSLKMQVREELVWQIAADAMVLSDRDGIVIDANPAYFQLYGYSPDEVIGKDFSIIFPESRRAQARQAYRDLFANGTTPERSETQVLCADGSLRFVESRIEFIYRDGQRIAMLSMIRDITARKQMEETLTLHQQRYRLATQAGRVGVWDWDLQTNEFYLDPTVKRLLGYQDHEIPNDLNVWITYVHPDDAGPVMAAAQAHIDGQTAEYKFEHRMIHKDGSVRWFLSRGTVLRDEAGRAIRMVGTDADITARKQIEIELHQTNRNLQKRNNELYALNQIAQAAASNTDLQSVLHLITETTSQLLNASSTYIGWIANLHPEATGSAQGQILSIPIDESSRTSARTSARGAGGEIDMQMIHMHDLPFAEDPLIQRMLHQQRSVVVSRDQSDEIAPHLHRFMRQLSIDSLTLVPLVSRESLIGLMVIALDHPGRRFTTEEIALAETVAGQVAGIVENVHLLYEALRQRQRAEQRNLELETILHVSREVTSTLELEPVVNTVLDQLKQVLEYQIGIVMVVEDEELHVAAYCGPLSQRDALEQRYLSAPLLEATGPFAQEEPWLTHDLYADQSTRQMLEKFFGKRVSSILGNARSWMAIPLRLHGRIIGLLGLGHETPGTYTTAQLDYVNAFALQAAVAIDNARLYQFARSTAVDEERTRLSRELHDAVTQTLFSANLIAEALPAAWQQSPDMGQRGLHELHQLTRSALAEMRTLLHELRPAALTQKSLPDLLRPLGEAVMGRAQVDFTFEAVGERTLPSTVQIAFYRVAQEALNNIFKHAAASRVRMNLHSLPQRVELEIHDNGVGFETEAVPLDRLGLEIMRERANSIGATLEIITGPQQGTQVLLRWQDKANGSDHPERPKYRKEEAQTDE